MAPLPGPGRPLHGLVDPGSPPVQGNLPSVQLTARNGPPCTRAGALRASCRPSSPSLPGPIHPAQGAQRLINLTFPLPKVLRDTLYRQLGHLTGLQKLHLGSGSGEAVGSIFSFIHGLSSSLKTATKRKASLINDPTGSPARLLFSALPHQPHLPLLGQRLHQ